MLLELKMRLTSSGEGMGEGGTQGKGASRRGNTDSKQMVGYGQGQEGYATAYAEPIVEGEVLGFDDKADDRYAYY